MGEKIFPRGIEVLTPTVILNDKDEVLLIKSTKSKLDSWEFAGGHVEPGETIAEASIREAKEETGLDCKQIYPEFKWYEEGILEGEGSPYTRNIHYLCFPIIMKVVGGELNIDANELKAIKWVSMSKVLDEPLDRYAQEFLTEFLEYRKNN